MRQDFNCIGDPSSVEVESNFSNRKCKVKYRLESIAQS